jgi:hypothetical protein
MSGDVEDELMRSLTDTLVLAINYAATMEKLRDAIDNPPRLFGKARHVAAMGELREQTKTGTAILVEAAGRTQGLGALLFMKWKESPQEEAFAARSEFMDRVHVRYYTPFLGDSADDNLLVRYIYNMACVKDETLQRQNADCLTALVGIPAGWLWTNPRAEAKLGDELVCLGFPPPDAPNRDQLIRYFGHDRETLAQYSLAILRAIESSLDDLNFDTCRAFIGRAGERDVFRRLVALLGEQARESEQLAFVLERVSEVAAKCEQKGQDAGGDESSTPSKQTGKSAMTPEEIKKRFNQLPEAVLNHLYAEAIGELNGFILEGNGLKHEHVRVIGTLVKELLVGAVALDDTLGQVQQRFALDPTQGRRLALDILGYRLLPLDGFVGDVSDAILRLGGNPDDYPADRVDWSKEHGAGGDGDG